MYPLLDTATMNRRAREGRQAAAHAREARRARAVTADGAPRHALRHAVGASLVRAGVRLTNA